MSVKYYFQLGEGFRNVCGFEESEKMMKDIKKHFSKPILTDEETEYREKVEKESFESLWGKVRY